MLNVLQRPKSPEDEPDVNNLIKKFTDLNNIVSKILPKYVIGN